MSRSAVRGSVVLFYSLSLSWSLAACTDSTGPGTFVGAPLEYGARTVAELHCTASARPASLECSAPAGSPGDGVSRALLGQGQARLRSSNVRYDTLTTVFSFDVTLENLLSEPLGTPDSVTATGSKAFYETGPTATSFYAPGDTGTVRVGNADGVGNFTGPSQPYHFFPGILPPGDMSAPLRWELRIPRAVKTFAFTLRVFSATPSEPKVPATALDTVPAWIFAPSNLGTDMSGLTGTFVRNVVTLAFQPDATLEERQVALDRVHGTVVGGEELDQGDGIYYVQVPVDGTAWPLLDAVDALEGLPQVLGASLLEVDNVTGYYQKPDDGAGWNEWALDRAEADSVNWALEAIAAPYAWGCSTGDSTTRIAVVDQGFHLAANADLRANLGSSRFIYSGWPSTTDHGAKVASVLASRGDNGAGMTGVMWRARLDLVEVGTSNAGVPTLINGNPVILNTVQRISAAIGGGGRVVNVSLGLGWDAAGKTRIQNNQATAADSNRVNELRRALNTRIRWHRLFGKRPLIVFAAGNDAVDAYWSGYPDAERTFPDQVLSVASATWRGGTSGYAGGPFDRRFTSNWGDRVGIAAPGTDVSALDGNGAVVPVAGTSIAAPMVAGVAGLLVAFDPRLTAGELKTLLIEGARRGGWKVDNGGGAADLPVLNAHESLKLAAEREGAPLCGNRVWVQGTGVWARRDAGHVERLFTVRPEAEQLQVLHGGKRIHFYDDVDYRFFEYGSGSWSETAVPPADWEAFFGQESPTYRSLVATSHDDDTIVFTRSGSGHTEVVLESLAIGSQRTIGTIPILNAGGMTWECTRRFTTVPVQCGDSTLVGTATDQWLSLPVYAPRGDRVLVARNTAGETTTLGAWYTCPGQGTGPSSHWECRDRTTTQSVGPGTIFVVSTRPGVATTSFSTEPYVFSDLAIGDGTEELVVQREGGTTTIVAAWSRDTTTGEFSSVPTVVSSSVTACATEFRQLATNQMVELFPGCEWGTNTFAPDRSPASTPRSRSMRMHGEHPLTQRLGKLRGGTGRTPR